MQLDKYLPTFHVRSRHKRDVSASPERTYHAARNADFGRSRVIATLFKLRGLPAKALTMDGIQTIGFGLLQEQPPNELVLGVIANFKRLDGEMHSVSPDDYPTFAKPGHIVVGWNFLVVPDDKGTCTLRTETRIRCTSRYSRVVFAIYWFFIGPFSGWIRRRMLALIARDAEAPTHEPPSAVR